MEKCSVRASKVCKTYKSGGIEVRALSDISFSLNEGDFVAILGPSGSGKSTLMNILGTIDKPTSGHVFIDGIDASVMNDAELAKFRNEKLGFVFQAFNLVNGLSALKNVELPLMLSNVSREEREQRAVKLLTRLGLGQRLNLKPTQLSGGEQQRVAVARALINNPTMILADEPTGNLDTKSGDEVINILREIARSGKVTVIMVTHNLEITKHCDKIIRIRDGKMEKGVTK